MKLKQAIKILEEQKQKVLNPEYPNNDEWIVQTASYIKDFFGINSSEYFRIANFKWSIKVINTTSNDDRKYFLKEKKENIVLFLDNCKRTLKNKGLFKEPKKNIFSGKSDFEIIGIIFGICVFVFWIGYWTKKFEVFSVLSQDKTSISTPTINSSENKPNNHKKVTESKNSKNE